MTRRVVLRRALADRVRWLIGWSIGIVALVVMTIAFWPSFEDQAAELNDMLDNLPDSLKSLFGMGGGVDLFSPVGYLSSQIYALMLPLLLLIGGIGAAAGVAGDEEHGLLETTYSLPITRTRVVLERGVAVMLATGALALVSFVSVLGISRLVGLDIGILSLWWATVSVVLITWAFAAVTLAVGAWSGRRGVAIAAASTVATAMYIVTGLADAGIGFFETIEPASLFTHYDVLHSLQHGAPPWSLLVLVAVVVVGTGLAAWVIDRRDLRAG